MMTSGEVAWFSRDEVLIGRLLDRGYKAMTEGLSFRQWLDQETDKRQARAMKDQALREKYLPLAEQKYSSEGQVEIDDSAVVSDSEDGAYVAAWVWVEDPDPEEEDELVQP